MSRMQKKHLQEVDVDNNAHTIPDGVDMEGEDVGDHAG